MRVNHKRGNGKIFSPCLRSRLFLKKPHPDYSKRFFYVNAQSANHISFIEVVAKNCFHSNGHGVCLFLPNSMVSQSMSFNYPLFKFAMPFMYAPPSCEWTSERPTDWKKSLLELPKKGWWRSWIMTTPAALSHVRRTDCVPFLELRRRLCSSKEFEFVNLIPFFQFSSRCQLFFRF